MSSQIKKELILEGLNCAGCAVKIENQVAKLENVVSASMNFATKIMTVEIVSEKYSDLVVRKATDIIVKLEPHVVVKEKSKKGIESDKGLKENIGKNKKIAKLIIGLFLFVIALIFKLEASFKIILYFISYILVGWEVIVKAFKNIIRGQIFDENFLMALATVGAFSIGEYPEGVAVMIFYQIGEFFQDMAVDHSRKSIGELMDIRPDFANLKVGDIIEKVSPDSVRVGDIIIIKPGEKVPIDGKIIIGNSILDTSAITGEPVPRKVSTGDEILSGMINQSSVLTVETTKEFGESTVSKILELVENASNKKSSTENFITKFARYYTPVVVFIALALATVPPLVNSNELFKDWIYRSLVFLVVSCPCALVISIPLGFFGGIGGAAKFGILMKGSNYLEALNNVGTVVFDKTGTITKGTFKVTKIVASSYKDSDLLMYAAYGEFYSNHPIAKSIMATYGKDIEKNRITDFEEISGHGIKAHIDSVEIFAGNIKLMKKANIIMEDINIPDELGTIIHVAVDGKYGGYILISDEIKENAKQTMDDLRKLGVKKIVMFTGDNASVADKIGKILGLDNVFSELLPQEKVENLEILERNEKRIGNIVFVGDGINDAPVLARADVGIAMGGVGSDAAIEAADVVLMTDELHKIVDAIKFAKRTRKIVWQNIIFAFTVKAFVLILGAGGLATMWEAVFADVGVAIIAILNAMRILNTKTI